MRANDEQGSTAIASTRPRTPSTLRPFLKWAGGKRGLLNQFERYFPPRGTFRTYLEPFLGSGAVFFFVRARLGVRRAHLFDKNAELIETYRAIQREPEAVIAKLQEHARLHSKRHYYHVRACSPDSPIARAARLIYLNRTCFNGLYRVNAEGRFNVPIGRYQRPRILDADNLLAVSRALQDVKLTTADFREFTRWARHRDLVYLDPPYDPLSSTARFTGYTRGGFGKEDQQALAETYQRLHARGCKLMLSNSDTPFIRDLYRGFNIITIDVPRKINARGDRRGAVREVLVLNYE